MKEEMEHGEGHWYGDLGVTWEIESVELLTYLRDMEGKR